MPGVNNTKRIPCSRNPKDHGHHPQNEKCGYCPTVSPFADTLPRVSMADYQPEVCPHVGTYACGCVQCLIYQQGLYP